ncbi:hypothetical protein Q3G72_003799 [Acer saccharum]|nr:hypothetical protein Q3G72_003799 [Acer saccharum]
MKESDEIDDDHNGGGWTQACSIFSSSTHPICFNKSTRQSFKVELDSVNLLDSLTQIELEMADLVANKVGISFDDNTNDTAKNVFDLGAFVGDLTFEEDAGSDDISLEGLEQELEECKNYDARHNSSCDFGIGRTEICDMRSLRWTYCPVTKPIESRQKEATRKRSYRRSFASPHGSRSTWLVATLIQKASSGDVARSNCLASLYKMSIDKEWRLAGKRRTKAGSIKAKCDIAFALFNFFFNLEFFKSEARRCIVGSYV